MNLSVTPKIETSVSVLTILDNGVGQMHFKDGITMDIPEQMEHLKGLIELTGGKPTPFIVTAGKDVIITKDARDNAIVIEDQAPVNATAVVVQNLAYQLIADFYLKINKPKNPYKVFRDEAKAIEWCKQFLGKNKLF